MVHRGKFEYERERERDLLRVYKEVIEAEKQIDLLDVIEKVVNSPASRFWANEEIAVRHIRRMLRGDDIGLAYACRRELYEEVLRRVKVLRKEQPKMSINRAVRQVLKQPAPKFYLTPGSVKEYLFKVHRRAKNERKSRLK